MTTKIKQDFEIYRKELKRSKLTLEFSDPGEIILSSQGVEPIKMFFSNHGINNFFTLESSKNPLSLQILDSLTVDFHSANGILEAIYVKTIEKK